MRAGVRRFHLGIFPVPRTRKKTNLFKNNSRWINLVRRPKKKTFDPLNFFTNSTFCYLVGLTSIPLRIQNSLWSSATCYHNFCLFLCACPQKPFEPSGTEAVGWLMTRRTRVLILAPSIKPGSSLRFSGSFCPSS